MFHKSLQFNAGIAKPPTQTLRIQNNYVFMAIYAVFKLECLSVRSKTNPMFYGSSFSSMPPATLLTSFRNFKLMRKVS